MACPSSSRTDARRRGILCRLHRDERGLASIEFVLAAPVIMLIVLFVGHANRLSTKKIETMHEMRSAAFAKANGLPCSPDFSSPFPIETPDVPPADDGERIRKDSLSCETRDAHDGAGADGRTLIWNDINKIAEDEGAVDKPDTLAGALAQEVPQLVTAKAARLYRFSRREGVRPFTWRDDFTVDDATLFVSDKDVTRRGYDPTLRKAVRDVSAGADELFDGIFPGAE